MNTQLHPVMAAALAPFAPPQSVVRQIVRDGEAAERRAERLRIERQQDYLRATSQAYDFPRDFNTVENRL